MRSRPSARGRVDSDRETRALPVAGGSPLAGPRRSPEPLSGAVALLAGGVDDPLLARQVDDLARHALEPLARAPLVADAAPQLADEVGDHGPLGARHAVPRVERLLEGPRRLAPE